MAHGNPNEAGPSGIIRASACKNRHKKRAQHVKNVQMRGALYAEMRGENGTRRAGEWHERLKALSVGAAG